MPASVAVNVIGDVDPRNNEEGREACDATPKRRLKRVKKRVSNTSKSGRIPPNKLKEHIKDMKRAPRKKYIHLRQPSGTSSIAYEGTMVPNWRKEETALPRVELTL